MDKIIIGVHILKKPASSKIPDPAGLPVRIQLLGHPVRPRVETVMVSGFIDAHAPEDNAGPVPVPFYHFLDILDGNVLPAFASA